MHQKAKTFRIFVGGSLCAPCSECFNCVCVCALSLLVVVMSVI